ncbi:PleD family two-component system response regulator [Caulobacter sp. UNC358MFTsu5.1]|uniref:response regulator n=1 Tax=Caulobacter sp. UNC358MFTsu5.1 TaxID=1449049 RepID=UPI0004A77999|nr:response regulator [Caulobacter sp. UNC358MFTsu5.1]
MPNGLILVADDDPLLRSILEHKLTRAGYRVILAEDGGAALEQARALRPAVLVLDAMMPVLDGFEVLRRLKDDDQTRDLTVFMLTALKRQDDVVSALQLGAADYLAKPFNPDELVARLARLSPSEVV